MSLLFFSLWASLARLLPLGFLIPFINSAFPWAISNFIGLPWPNYFILILGVHGLAINPLFSLFALLLGLLWLILTFSTSYTAHTYAISLFSGFCKPIYLLKAHLFIYELVIHHSCRLGLMALPLVCQTFAALVAGLFAFHLDPQK